MLPYQPTPLLDISDHPLLRNAGVRVLMKREDLNHPRISGNKWWKLKYNLAEAVRLGHKTILTFGGAYSNHIYATAAATKEAGLSSIGIIRGEEVLPLNTTLRFAAAQGMTLQYVDRQTYRDREAPEFPGKLRQQWGDFFLVPEGGTNELAVAGCEEFGKLLDAVPAQYIVLPVGTGGTMAGIIRGASPGKKIIGVSVLKDGRFLEDRIRRYLTPLHTTQWELMTQYSYGGYAKRSDEVTAVIRSFQESLNLGLDFVYTGKMMCAVIDLVRNGYFRKGDTVVVVHTGGMQGHS